jgi:hypothetical protein
MVTFMQSSSLQKSMSNYMARKLHEINPSDCTRFYGVKQPSLKLPRHQGQRTRRLDDVETWSQCYKSFYGCKLLIFVIS